MYGKSTRVGRHPGSGLHTVTTLQPSLSPSNFGIIASVMPSSANQNRTTVASDRSASRTSPHTNSTLP